MSECTSFEVVAYMGSQEYFNAVPHPMHIQCGVSAVMIIGEVLLFGF